MRGRSGLALILGFAVLGTAAASGTRGIWQNDVSAKDRVRVNPLAGKPEAVAAGAQIYREHCASCHGPDAGGRRNRPSLRSRRVQDATDGELQWLIRNGSLRNGMPAWANLPEVQRWQLVSYLRELPQVGVRQP